MLGKILRIDPTGSDSANGSYGIPEDNPFVDDSTFVPEIWAYGFRCFVTTDERGHCFSARE